MKSLPILRKNSQKSPCARRGVLVSRRLYARFAVNSSSCLANALAPPLAGTAGGTTGDGRSERSWDTSNPSRDPVDRRAGGRHRRRREVPLRASKAHAPSEARSFGYGRVRLPLCRHSVLPHWDQLFRCVWGGAHKRRSDSVCIGAHNSRTTSDRPATPRIFPPSTPFLDERL